MEWLLTNGPYEVHVDNEIQTVSFNRPSKEAPRVISFVPELEDIPKVVPGDKPRGPMTHKDYLVVDGEPRLYSAMSSIHQDLEDSTYSGPFGAAAIEWCQMLDMKLRDYYASKDSSPSKFQAAQEGICNSIGAAVNVITAGEDYSFYEQLVEDRYLGEPAAHEHEVLYPKLSREEFRLLSEHLLAD